jgi:secondary thiamine-phosphate synthase enzyme
VITALERFELRTRSRDDWIDATDGVREAVAKSGVREGVCVVFVPHTTAAVTVNENADPDVPRDVKLQLSAISPMRADFRHAEGNSDAHVKTSLVGPSVTLIVSGGRLILGTWQSVWFAEFDGPRTRTVYVRTMGE